MISTVTTVQRLSIQVNELIQINSHMYSRPCQKSMMELLGENNERLLVPS